MKPLNLLNKGKWEKFKDDNYEETTAFVKKFFKEAFPTYGQAAQLFNVGYQAIAQSPALLDYFETSLYDKLIEQGLEKALLPEQKLSMALNGVTAMLQQGYQVTETGLGFVLPVPQPQDVKNYDIWYEIRDDADYQFLQVGDTHNLAVSLSKGTPEATSIKQAQAFFINANMLLENSESCFPDATVAQVRAPNVDNTLNMPANEIYSTLQHIGTANKRLKTIFDLG